MDSNNGFTLAELMVAIAIIAIVASLTAPSFSSMIDKQRLQGAADRFYADLQLTRSEAIKRHTTVTLSATISEDDSWCYAQSDTGRCNCNIIAQCTIENIPSKVTKSSHFKNVKLSSTFANGSVTFSGTRGGTRAGRYVLTNNGITYQVVVDALGFPDVIPP